MRAHEPIDQSQQTTATRAARTICPTNGCAAGPRSSELDHSMRGPNRVGRHGTNSKTLGLLITATEYAVSAVQRMIQESDHRPQTLQDMLDRYVDLVFGLEVNFVFPTLTAQERDLLVSLMKVRNGLAVQLNGLPQWRTEEQKHEHHQATRELKAEFARLCREIEVTRLEDRLNQVQKHVLNEEFLSILLDKEDNTKLFFRKTVDQPQSERTPATATPISPGPAPTAGRRQKKILIIDRSPQDSEHIRDWLHAEGFDAILGTTGFECCRQALKEKPDLILLEFAPFDSDWPSDQVMDGSTILLVLRQLLKASSISVIALAPEDDLQVKEQVLHAGALACLRKPLDCKRLIDAVCVALEEPRTTDMTAN